MQGSVGDLITKFAKVAGVAVTFTAVLATLKKELTASYQASLKFNEGLANVGTLIPGQAERLNELKDAVKGMATETGKPLSDLTNGLYQVISAFGDNEETQERLNIVSKAGIAGMATTVDSLNLLSAVTKAYGDTSAKAMQKVSDLSFLTVKLGQTTFPELAGSIQQVTDSANRMGVSQEELFGGFATLTGVSGSASEVATQLRAALVALEGPSADLAKMYKELGVASGKSLIEQYGFQGALAEVLKYSDKTGVGLQALLGRVQAMSAASNLAGSQAETYAWKLDEIKKYAGATDEALLEVTDGINKNGFALKQLNEQYEVLKTSIGDKLVSAFSGTVEELTRLLGQFNAQNETLYLIKNSYDNLITSTGNYNDIVNQLETSQGKLTDIEERMLKIRKEQAAIDVSKALNDMARAYHQNQLNIEGYSKSIQYNAERQAYWVKRIEELREEQAKTAVGSRRYAELTGSIESAQISLNNATLNLTESQNDLRSANAETEAGLIEIATAYRKGEIDLSSYEKAFPQLYNRIVDVAANIQDVDLTPPTPDAEKTPQEMLDSFIGFSTKQLKDELKEWTLAREQALAYKADTSYIDSVISGLTTKIGDSEAEYVEKQKTILENQILQAQNSQGLLRLEADRKIAIASLNDENGETVVLQELINKLYGIQANLLATAYSKSLTDQQASLNLRKNELGIANQLSEIELERGKAIYDANQQGLDSADNLAKINKLYDDQKALVLSAKKEELDWRVKSNAEMTDSEKIELQRQREIAETNAKYGEQADLLALINAYYDDQQEQLSENTSLYDKMEEAFKGAVGKDAYKELQNLQRAIVKTGQFLQGFSMVWDSLSSAMTAYYDTQSALREADIALLEEDYETKRESADETIDALEDENDEQLEALEEMYDNDTISYADYQARKNAINTAYEAKKKDAQKAAIDAENALAQARYEAEKAQFEVDRKTAITKAIIAGAQGIMQAWALGPIAGVIGSGIIAGATAYQVSQIQAQPAPAAPALIPYAEGGIVTSPTAALIGEAGEPEAVIPLSKAGDFGFGGGGGDTYNISGNTFLGIDGVDELLILMERRKKVLTKRGMI